MLHNSYPTETVETLLLNNTNIYASVSYHNCLVMSLDKPPQKGDTYIKYYEKKGDFSEEALWDLTEPYPIVLSKNTLKIGLITSAPSKATLKQQYEKLTQQSKEVPMSNLAQTKLRNQTLYLMDGITSVEVAFTEGGFKYTYLALTSQNYAEGDVVILPSPKYPGSFMTGVVTTVHDLPLIDEEADFDYKFVAGKFDPTPYNKLLVKVDTAVEQFSKARHIAKRNAYRDAIINSAGGNANLLTLSED